MFGNFFCNNWFQCSSSGICQCHINSGSNRSDDVFLTSRNANDHDNPVKFLTDEYESLSVEEQIFVDNELYGREQPEIPETNEFVNGKFRELEMEINLLSEEITRPYFLALQQEQQREQEQAGGHDKDCTPRPTTTEYYVRSPEFRLAFLRADRFNSKFAARRITRYFREKLELFGESKLSKKLRLEDLLANELDKKALFLGPFCVTGATDKAGRLIILADRGALANIEDIPILNKRRAAFYLCALIEYNIESQKKGVVVINWNSSRKKNTNTMQGFFDYRLNSPLRRMMHHTLPMWVAGMHFCYHTVSEHVFLHMVLKALPKPTRHRCVLHYYMRHKEFILLIAKYGVDLSILPLNEKGEYDYDRLKILLEERGESEEKQYRQIENKNQQKII